MSLFGRERAFGYLLTGPRSWSIRVLMSFLKDRKAVSGFGLSLVLALPLLNVSGQKSCLWRGRLPDVLEERKLLNKNRINILIVGQTPPPYHGQSIAIQMALAGPYR